MSAVPVLGSVGNPGPQSAESKSKTNLIINYLPQTMSEEEVKCLFSSIGPVQSCKLIKDKLAQISLGYAFVNFHTVEDATRAIDTLNGLPMQNKIIKVSYARPSSTSIKNANLYVAYLPKSYNQSDLENLFRPFGTIITSKILAEPSGVSRGVGFVRFDQHAEAETAISTLNGKVLPTSAQPLLVKFANQPKNQGGGGLSPVHHHPPPQAVPTISASPIQTSVLSVSAGRRGLQQSGGPMRHSHPSLRYNPVSAALSSVPGGLTALAALGITTGTPQGGHAQGGGGGGGGGWCVFVYNLPEVTEDSLLYQLFSPFGAITSVKVIREPSSGKCKRYGFVNMVNYEEACQAIMTLNGYLLEGKPLQVSFKSSKGL